MSLALSICLSIIVNCCLLLISLIQLVNGVQFLNITFLSLLFTAAPAAPVLLALIK